MKWNDIKNSINKIDLALTSISWNFNKSWMISILSFSIAICNGALLKSLFIKFHSINLFEIILVKKIYFEIVFKNIKNWNSI